MTIIGAIYAAPNLFQPDSAIQVTTVTEIKGTTNVAPVDQALVDRAVSGLRSAGIIVIDTEIAEGS